MRKVRLVLLFGLASVLAVCSGARAGQIRTLRFGVCLSLTGEFSEAGKKMLAGIKLRLEDFNARANRTGLRLEAVVRDDKSDGRQAVRNVDDLAAKEGVPAIIGPLSTNLMLGMRDRARELEVVLISPTVTSPRIGKDGDWAFRVLFDDEFQGVALARFLARRQKMKRVAAIINDRLAYASSVFGSFKENIEKEGGSVVREEHYQWVADEDSVYDFTEAIRRTAEADPDIVLLPVNSTDVAAIIRCSTRMGVELRFCGGDTWQHENVLLSSGHNLEDSYFVSGVDFEANTPEMRRYIELYDDSHDPDLQLSSVLGYDALSLLIAAFAAGEDSHAVKDALYRVKDFRLATGTITIDPRRGSEKTAYIHRINMVGDRFEAAIIDEIKP